MSKIRHGYRSKVDKHRSIELNTRNHVDLVYDSACSTLSSINKPRVRVDLNNRSQVAISNTKHELMMIELMLANENGLNRD